jgi:cytochrome c-type biogenesis protein CcmH/NrfG
VVLQAIRRGKRKMRIPLIIMVAMLAFGLVGSYAIWSSPNIDNAQKDVDPQAMVDNLQISIDQYEKDLAKNPTDFTILKSLGEVRSQQGGFYLQLNDREKSQEVFAKGLENYLLAIEHAPEELNNQGQADLMVAAAYCASNGGQENTAGPLYQKAIQLTPEDFSARSNYVIFLAFYLQDIEAAKKEIADYKGLLPEGDERIAQADQLQGLIESLEQQSQPNGSAESAEQTDQAPTKDATEGQGQVTGETEE